MKEQEPFSKQKILEKKQVLSTILDERNNLLHSLEKKKPIFEPFLNQEIKLTIDTFKKITEAGHITRKVEHAKQSTQKSITRIAGKIYGLDQELNFYQIAEQYLLELSEKEKYLDEVSELAKNGYIPKEVVARLQQDVEKLKNQPKINAHLSQYISHVKESNKIEEKNVDTQNKPESQTATNKELVLIKQTTQIPQQETPPATLFLSLTHQSGHDTAYLAALTTSYPAIPHQDIEEIVTSAQRFRKQKTFVNPQQISGEKRRINTMCRLYLTYHIPSQAVETIYEINRIYEWFGIENLAKVYHAFTTNRENVDIEGVQDELIEFIELIEQNAHEEDIFSNQILKEAIVLLQENPDMTIEQLVNDSLENVHSYSWRSDPQSYAFQGEEGEKYSTIVTDNPKPDGVLENLIDAL